VDVAFLVVEAMTAGVFRVETLGAVTLGVMAILGAVAVARAPLTACVAGETVTPADGLAATAGVFTLATGVLTFAGETVTPADGLAATAGVFTLATGELTVAGEAVTPADGLAETAGVVTLATGELTVAGGTVTPTDGTAAGTAGVLTDGAGAGTPAAGVAVAGLFTETPTAGVVTDTTGTATLGTETLTPGRPAPWARSEPVHAPSASREARTAGVRMPRMVMEGSCHSLAIRNGDFRGIQRGCVRDYLRCDP
jgi:hypothetical protein